ncbi:MAG: hypothetical protein AB1806_16695 [Acidobacteriota bacterium]
MAERGVKGLVAAELTRLGRAQLETELESYERVSRAIARVLQPV